MTASDNDDRLTIRLSPAAKEAVDDIQKLGGFKVPQAAIRRAIADERFLQQWRHDGWEILLRKGNDYHSVVWPEETDE
jgi:predicted transcriptional regulator